MAMMAEATLGVVTPGVIHIGAYRSHTVVFLQIRQKTPRAPSDDLDVRWVRECVVFELGS